MRCLRTASLAVVFLTLGGCQVAGEHYDIVIDNGTVYDGSGNAPVQADIGIRGDRIVAIGDLDASRASEIIDASGLAVAPGFINMLSWATESLIQDGRSQGDIRQGVTLEVFGEGNSMGPLSPEMKARELESQGDFKFEIPWNTLGGYLEYLEARGVSPNVASFIGATSVRKHQIGYADRPPTATELANMRTLVREAMLEGALGVGSSLIYAPAFYADTDELVALMKVAAEYDGMYITHMRSEGARLLEAIDEVIEIAERSGGRAEIYHLKISGKENWHKLEPALNKIEEARARGVPLTADMYTYTAGSTGLDAAMPPWVQEGGYSAWANRLKNPLIRKQVVAEMIAPTDKWTNLMRSAGADNTILVGFRNPDLRGYIGRTLADVAAERNQSAQETAINLVIEDGSRVQVVYFLMSEENVQAIMKQPWVSFGSDARSMAPEGLFLNSGTHPRAYGNFARLLGKYVREEKVLTLTEAIRKLTLLPATNLKIRDRGTLKQGYFADLAIFDPDQIRDVATYDDPHRYAEGMVFVLVNGEVVLRDGEHTGALPGRFVRGPGWQQ